MLIVTVFNSVGSIIFEVCTFWWLRLFKWVRSKSSKDVLVESLGQANLFEEWEAAAFQLDEVLGYDLWRQNPTSKHYDYRLIYERLQAIIEAREEDDILGLVSLLRSGLVRNLGNITQPKLFSRAYAGTKLLIEDYVTQVALAVEYVTAYPAGADFQSGLTHQSKMDVLHDTRQAFGRSALVLQGGSIFGLCHIGVVKALHLRGLLPRIISGTATGALIAALVGVHTEEELLGILSAEGIDLSAFNERSKKPVSGGKVTRYEFEDHHWLATTVRRLKRLFKDGHLLDTSVLEECVRANVGDMTFEEAYMKTKRVLNITVATASGGVPNLLNYLTAPNVLIWSAALASNTSSSIYSPFQLKCKDEFGTIMPWPNSEDATFRHWSSAHYTDHDSPLARIGELFNVNHFIVSQARPYIAPFLRSDFHHADPRHERRWKLSLPLVRLVILEVQHRLTQLDALGLVPAAVRRFLLDESVPGASLLLVPEIGPRDFLRLLENPTAAGIEHWIRRGERSVWPAVGALKVRCAIEVELDRGYQLVRRRKPFDVATPNHPASRRESTTAEGSESLKKRDRASSFGAGAAQGGFF
ncbi:hypothetical protein BT63DRAFT_289911 [Microthyrium microscopicum]|uniref:PNPLA domain-containing protein n=1 Tax=Microthyrium microscopicum TaxID=703497 RepID=A0A6A6U897_9PEZI|nr:hypothetical protein BT63DRAFT_289911 [Microthyrium microscopicum]